MNRRLSTYIFSIGLGLATLLSFNSCAHLNPYNLTIKNLEGITQESKLVQSNYAYQDVDNQNLKKYGYRIDRFSYAKLRSLAGICAGSVDVVVEDNNYYLEGFYDEKAHPHYLEGILKQADKDNDSVITNYEADKVFMKFIKKRQITFSF